MLYTKEHDWILLHQDDSSLAKVGISHFAQKEIGEIVFIDLPKVGQILQKGEVAVVLESTKAAIDIYAVASGEVLQVNEALIKNPSLINHSAEEEGWLYFIRFHTILLPPDRFGLLRKEAYRVIS
ncbi:MAG: glycine cleavage system protein GcvH [Chlamydiae bacterium]|nr:glycine cleavage system protein GcvH [Chlamydiota bacterium]